MGTLHENLVQSFTNFKNKFLKANGKDFHFAYDSTTQKYGYTIDGTFYPFRKVQASKTVTAGTSATTVTPDSGNDGIASVTVNPTPSETKTQAAGTSNIDVTPTSGKLLSKVTVSPTPSQAKSVTATTSAQTVSPDSGKLLSSVTVNPQNHSDILQDAAPYMGYVTEPFGGTTMSSIAIVLPDIHNYKYIKANGIPVSASVLDFANNKWGSWNTTNPFTLTSDELTIYNNNDAYIGVAFIFVYSASGYASSATVTLQGYSSSDNSWVDVKSSTISINAGSINMTYVGNIISHSYSKARAVLSLTSGRTVMSGLKFVLAHASASFRI